MSLKKIITLLFIICASKAFAQHELLDKITDSITTEGKALFRSEWTSWYGTDVFEAKCPSKVPLSGGYFSYETGDNLINIFYSKGDNPDVLAAISFEKDLKSEHYILDTIRRPFNDQERDYYTIRKTAAKRATIDTTFRYFKNTSLNMVPLIQKGVKRVYALTGPKANGVVIFGNDYLMNFNNSNEITSVQRLHKSIIPFYNTADTSKAAKTTMHSHLPQTGDFITATDICTLMLYEKFTTWEQHYVISKNDISIWDCKKNNLLILTMEVWKKINEDQQKRHPDKQ
jgi:hypothetical protein